MRDYNKYIIVLGVTLILLPFVAFAIRKVLLKMGCKNFTTNIVHDASSRLLMVIFVHILFSSVVIFSDAGSLALKISAVIIYVAIGMYVLGLIYVILT